MRTPQSTPVTTVPTWKTVLTILALVFFTPLGLIFMFVWMKWPGWVKAVVSVLLVLYAIFFMMAVFAGILVAMINPVELTKRARDTARIQDLTDIRLAIEQVSAESATPIDLCSVNNSPCISQSNNAKPNVRSLNGDGWVQVDLTGTFADGELPVDPLNNSKHYYKYCSDGNDWEVESTLESEQLSPRATTDGGDKKGFLEIGSVLTVCPL